jgi:hypothetical protein
MRSFTGLSAVCLLLLGAVAAGAQEKPNFTGTWKMNLEKSRLSDGTKLPYFTEFIREIDHKEPALRVTEKIKAPEDAGGDRTLLWNARTDGTASQTMGDDAVTISVKWNDNRLVERIAGEQWDVVRTCSLSADGKTITVHFVLSTDGGSQEGTEVWEKQ